jgi:hypothetical protein
MEDLIELTARGLARVFLFISRILLFLLWQGLCETLFWYIGWLVTRAITLGRFPEQGIAEIEKENGYTQAVVIIIGAAVPFVFAFYLVRFLNTSVSGV